MCGLFFLGCLSFVGFCLPFKLMCGFLGVGYKYVRGSSCLHIFLVE